MSAVVIDTHVLIWYTSKSSLLSTNARVALETAENHGELIYVPAIVVVELRYLVEKKTISESDYQNMLTALRDPLTVLTVPPMSLDVAATVTQIPRATVPDMPDRIIAANALALSLPLVTKDHKIRNLTNIVTIW